MLKYELNGKGYTVVKNEYKDASIVIPNSYKGKPVTSIGEDAFYSCASLTVYAYHHILNRFKNGLANVKTVIRIDYSKVLEAIDA